MFSLAVIHIFVIVVGSSLGMKPPFISEWQTIAAQGQSPIYIPHSLGEMPIKVDVQVRVVREGSQHIFPAFGAGQRSDEDGDSQYGAVLCSYNESHVRLHVPVSAITTKGGLVSTAGFVGPFDAYYTTADVRVRAWRICDFPPANYSSNIYGVGGPPYTPGGSILHNLGVTPDLVIVQLKMWDGFVYEADGAVFKDRRISSDRACGTVVAYDNMHIRIWGMAKRQGIAGLVGCAYKGWGTQYMADLALLIISAWILPSEDKVVSISTVIAKTTAHVDTVPLSPSVSIDNHLFIVKVKAIEGNNNGFIFHGAGTSLTDGSLTNYGGVIFGYNESEVLLWRPADSNTNSYIWYRGGDLGGGDYPQTSTTAEVTVDILRTVTPIEENCGPGKCVGDWTQSVVVCDCFGTGLTGQYCTTADGPPPSALQAGVEVNEDPNLHLGSKRNLTIKLVFPMGTTPDIVVSVKASDTKEIMAIGSLVLKETGNNIQPLKSSFSYKASTASNLTGFHVVTSASLSFGDVVNTGLSSLYMNNMVTIESEVYVQSVDNVTDGSVHAVKIQVLKGGIVVWNKDIIYTINTTLLVPNKTPEVFTIFPVVSDLQRGLVTRISVDLWMPLANPDIVIEARSLSADGSESVLRVVRLSVTQIGENYQLPAVVERLKIDKADCHDVIGNVSLSLVFPTHFANKEAFVPGPTSIKDLIQFETLLYMGPDSEVGTIYPLDFIIYVDGAILWNSSFSLTSTEPTGLQITTNIDKQLSLTQLTIGQVFSTDVNLTLPDMGVFKFKVSLTSLIAEGQGISGLILLSAAIGDTGSSVVCSSLTASYNRTGSSKIQNVANVFINVTNFGPTNVPGGNSSWLVLRFTAVAAPGYTDISDVHTVEVSSGALSVVYFFNVTGTSTFDQNVVYTADIYHFNTGTCLSENQTFELFINITTERSKSPGPLYVHFPFGDTVFSVHEYKIIHVGENLRPCCQSMQLDGSLDQYLTYSDGSLGNITLEFPLFCNQEVSTDAVDDQLTIRAVARIRNDIRTEGSSLNNFTVVFRSVGLFSDVTTSLGLIVKSMTILPKTEFITGVEILKNNLNITLLPLVCHIKCRKDDQSFFTTTLEYERESATHVVYAFESRCMTSAVVLEDSIPGNTSSCCVLHQFITLNVEDNFMIFNDANDKLRSKIPSLVDGSNDTCLDLPVLGQTPPILWMRMNISGIWGLFSSGFRLSVFGNNINCDNQNEDSVLRVFYPSSILSGDFHGDVTYCFLSEKYVAPLDPLTRCSFQCPCVGPQCVEAFLYIASNNVSKTWKLCELFVENV